MPEMRRVVEGVRLQAAAAALAALLVVAVHGAVLEDEIKSLPYYDGALPSRHFSGYLPVNGGKQFHYWLVESENSTTEDPLVLWLNGGPGCSSMYGFMFENGPFMFDRSTTDLTLYLNPFAWNKIANMLFVESPACVGFSYGEDASACVTNDTQTAIDNYSMLQSFFALYPEYIGRDFYISGESYAGMYIPMLADQIRVGNAAGQPRINLVGFLVGNGVTEPYFDSVYNSLAPFSVGHGLISLETYDRILACNGGETPGQPDCVRGLAELSASLVNINRYQIYDKCYANRRVPAGTLASRQAQLEWSSDGVMGDIPCINTDQGTVYFNLPEVKEAIHVRGDIEWTICSNTLRYTKNLGSDSYQFYPELIENYRIIIFSGDTDAAVPHTGSEKWTRHIHEGKPVVRPWRSWQVDGQVAGYVIAYEKLQYVTFKGGWHTVPESHPAESLHMLRQFFRDEPL